VIDFDVNGYGEGFLSYGQGQSFIILAWNRVGRNVHAYKKGYASRAQHAAVQGTRDVIGVKGSFSCYKVFYTLVIGGGMCFRAAVLTHVCGEQLIYGSAALTSRKCGAKEGIAVKGAVGQDLKANVRAARGMQRGNRALTKRRIGIDPFVIKKNTAFHKAPPLIACRKKIANLAPFS
jgi:hypothetical protein